MVAKHLIATRGIVSASQDPKSGFMQTRRAGDQDRTASLGTPPIQACDDPASLFNNRDQSDDVIWLKRWFEA